MSEEGEPAPAAGIDTTVHRALSQDTRVRLLRALTAADTPLGARELAEQVDLHLTTVRAHLEVLREAGLVESEPETRTAPGRPRVLYRATAAGAPRKAEGPAREVDGPACEAEGRPREAEGYRLLAEMLVSHLAHTAGDPVAQGAAAGRVWGEHLTDRPRPFADVGPDEARRRVAGLFDRLGFEPELDEDGTRLLLWRCPFLEVAQRHPDVVCSVHLGLLQGALDALGNPLTADHLEPFIERAPCVAHLGGPAG